MDKNITVLFFGQLTDVTGTASVGLADACDTDTVKKKILELYPALENHTYTIALDRKVISGNVALSGDQVMVFMPPFSGG